MIQLSRWKIIVLVASLVFGVLFALPTVLTPAQREALPPFMPKNGLNLGLDLQGGSYLLLEVDVEAMRAERVANLLEEVRVTLRAEGIPSTALVREDNGVVATFDPAVVDQARTALLPLARSGPGFRAPGR